MKRKPMGRKKDVRRSRLTLDKKSFTRKRGETHEHVNGRVLNDLQKHDFYGRLDLVYAAAVHKDLPSQFLPIFTEDSSFHQVVEVSGHLSGRGYIEWLLGLFSRSIDLLRIFCETKKVVSSEILLGRPKEALTALDFLSEKSLSWWEIEKSIHIKKELLETDAKASISALETRFPKIRLTGKAQELLLLSESNSIGVYIDALLGRQKEYKSSKIADAIISGHTESAIALPMCLDPTRRPSLKTMRTFSNFSIIDQYHYFRMIVVEQKLNGEDEFPDIIQRVTNLAVAIGDDALFDLLDSRSAHSTFVEEIVDHYTRGLYPEVASAITKKLSTDACEAYGLIEIYARCKAYTDNIGSGDLFYDKLADEFAQILQLSPLSSECRNWLEKICVKFRDEPWAKSLHFHLLFMDRWDSEVVTVDSARRATFELGKYNTPKASSQNFHLDASMLNAGAIPEDRLIRYSNKTALTYDPSIFVIPSDYLQTQSSAYVESGLQQEAIDFCVDAYLHSPFSFSHLPIATLCKSVPQLIRDTTEKFLYSLLLLDIYSKEKDGRFDELAAEIFEEFIQHCGTPKPSEYFSGGPLTSLIVNFLKRVCVPSQLDNIIEFDSNDEVVLERVAIIDLLISRKAQGQEELLAEKDAVVETLFAEKLRAKIESGKLFVDVQAIEAHRRQAYLSLYEQAKKFPSGLQIAPLDVTGETINSTDVIVVAGDRSLAFATTEQSDLLVRIFNQASDDFALNAHYGLDKYLSAEIRHNVFHFQLRSCFEKTNLVTVQEDGAYLSNAFWLKKYHFVADHIPQKIDRLLCQFSEKVDRAITAVNEQFRVRFTPISDAAGLFDFSPYHERVKRISEIVNNSKSFDVFFKTLIAYMWDIAAEGAREAQKLINEQLLPDILHAIEALECDVAEARGRVAMVDLYDAIQRARSNFTSEIELVLNWFRFIGVDDDKSNERLSVVIEAAVSAFSSLFRHKNKNLVFTSARTDIEISYSEARALFISLYTALENSLRYGVEGAPVEIQHSSDGEKEQVVISNRISEEFGDPDEFIREEKKKWSEENAGLSNAEGGTGMYKIHNLLTNAAPGFSFNISITSGKFNALIGLNHEMFAHRRQSSQT
ncbi:MAG TPA: hypothetical protein DIS96_14125 [Pusillimonas sp.]|nr:hypothetical protein [Pusillimonas sp.]